VCVVASSNKEKIFVTVCAKTGLVCTINFCPMFNSYHYTLCIQFPYLISLLFPGQLLTLCKYGIEMIVPMKCTKWIASTWNCTLHHSCVHLASWLTIVYSGVHVFTVELLWTLFDKLLPPPASPSPPTCLPSC